MSAREGHPSTLRPGQQTPEQPAHTLRPQPALREGALILGIETSCDETAASVVAVEHGRLRVRSNTVSSQNEVHERFAGVVPELASRAHLERLLPVLHTALEQAGATLADVHAIAVGHRPGLIGSLLVGTAAAKALAWSRNLPLLGVDHVAAHLVAGLLDAEPVQWPALGLVVSGGHTHLLHADSPLHLRVLGRTVDDAVGEAFDKAAVMLNLGYPGGPRLDTASEGGNDAAVSFPLPTLHEQSDRQGRTDVSPALCFSFSGLKTALLYQVRGVPPVPGRPAPPPPAPLTPERVRDLCASFQRAAVAQVVDRTRKALVQSTTRTLLVGGGVSANRRLRKELSALAHQHSAELRLPPLPYCMDNAAMIAGLAHYRLAADQADPWWLAPSPRSVVA